MERILSYEIDDSSTAEEVAVNFNPEPRAASGRSFRAGPTVHHGLQLRVGFGASDDPTAMPAPTVVSLRSPSGVTAGELSRFPWNRWLRVAEAASRLRTQYTVAGLEEANRSGAEAVRASRPGRKGHDPSHYIRIATRYLALTSDGDRNPVQHIADEEHVSRNTAAGWIREARNRALLPPSRRGRVR